MSVIALTSAHASGVTVSSLAMALAGPRPSLLAEADAKGGSIRTGYRMGEWGGEVGLWHLAQADREGSLGRKPSRRTCGDWTRPAAGCGCRA